MQTKRGRRHWHDYAAAEVIRRASGRGVASQQRLGGMLQGGGGKLAYPVNPITRAPRDEGATMAVQVWP